MIAAKGDLMNSIVDVDAGSFKRFDRDELIELLTGARRAALAAGLVRTVTKRTVCFVTVVSRLEGTISSFWLGLDQ
jgi:hypothetical protein